MSVATVAAEAVGTRAAAGAGAKAATSAAGTAGKSAGAGGLRPDAYRGGSQMATEFPAGKPKPAASGESGEPPTEEPQEDSGEADQAPTESSSRRSWPRTSGAASDGAAVILGVLIWTWVVLPALDGGPSRVKDVLRAKLTNHGPDGQELP